MNFDKITEWAKARLAEVTTLDGVVFVGFGIAVIALKPLATVIGAAAIAYGAYRIVTKEKN